MSDTDRQPTVGQKAGKGSLHTSNWISGTSGLICDMNTSVQSYEFGSPIRRNVFLAIFVLVGLAYTARLIQLQIIEGSDYRSISEAQAIKQLVVEPVRGSM